MVSRLIKPEELSNKQIEHLLRATAAFSPVPERDIALLLVLYGMALTTTELAKIAVSDYIDANNLVRENSVVRPGVAHNGEERNLYWSNTRIVAALDKYLEWRLAQKHLVTGVAIFRGLAPDSPIFLTDLGRPYSLTPKTMLSGHVSLTSNALGAVLTRLHANAGVKNGNAQSARKLWARRQYRDGVGIQHIAAILGHQSLETTRRLVSGEEVSLSDIVARAI